MEAAIKKATKPCDYIFIIRHGDRADKHPHLGIKYKRPHDPPLTPYGQQ